MMAFAVILMFKRGFLLLWMCWEKISNPGSGHLLYFMDQTVLA